MSPRVGDICEVSGRSGLWVVVSTNEPCARGFPPNVKGIQPYAAVYFSHCQHPTAFTVKHQPQLEVGERYRWNGSTVEVTQVDGDMVTIRNEHNTKPLKGGGQIRHSINRSYINRGLLIAENLDSILKKGST